MANKCFDCENFYCLKGSVRGIMDCDPDEYYCYLDKKFFLTEDSSDCEDFVTV